MIRQYVENLLKETDDVLLVPTPMLPRIEKFFTERDSLLDKQHANILLCFISRIEHDPKLTSSRIIEFIKGERDGKTYLFLSKRLYKELVNESDS